MRNNRTVRCVVSVLCSVILLTGCGSKSSSKNTTTSTASTTTTIVVTTSTAAPTTTTVAPPVLGKTGAFTNGAGFGEVKPVTVFYGGDETGMVSNVVWSSWGGAMATGSGTGIYVAPNAASVADGATSTPATIIAYDLGTCAGKSAYQKVAWYFPSKGETQAQAERSAGSACTGP